MPIRIAVSMVYLLRYKMFSNLTKKITGVEKSRDASDGIKGDMILKSFDCPSPISDRYTTCADCPSLKEEFKVFGVTLKDHTPVCGECGCNLWLKIPMGSENCPLGKWQLN